MLTINFKQGNQFGFLLPFLPDFLSDHTLLGTEPSERLPEHHRRWAQFIASLWREQADITYNLRFDWMPNATASSESGGGSVTVYLLGHLHDTSYDTEVVVHDVETALQAFGFEPHRLDSARLAQCRTHLLENYATGSSTCFEVRQHGFGVVYQQENTNFDIPKEFNYPTGNVAGSNSLTMFALHPWFSAGGSYLVTFNALTSQQCPASICILLQPTRLTDKESALLAGVARAGESLAQQATGAKTGMGGIQVQATQNRTDPQMRWAARLYAANLRRLSQPFLCSAFCFATHQTPARQIAQAVASTIREETPFDKPLGESETIQSGATVVSLSTPLALKMCGQLAFDYERETITRSSDVSSSALSRLPYLMDARGAATAFRLPVSVRGGVPGVEVKQRPPDFHPGPRIQVKPTDHIELGKFHTGGLASLDVQAFKKHALITGFTGSGKTTTVLNILHQFWFDQNIPFLVIESAKKEYRGFLQNPRFRESLLIYTLGNETCAPMRLNPFELLPGMRVEAHTNRLQACFEAALPPLPFLPSMLAEALERVYKKYWWVPTDVYEPATQQGRRFPRMSDFYEMVGQVAKDRNYAGEMQSNIVAATTGRIKQLLIGSIGMMFDTERSVPAELLLQRPTILELNDLNLQDKSLVMMFLLTLLREYRELNSTPQISHLTVVEEAHNVLQQTESQGTGEGAGADTRAKSVEAFSNMLAEVRALGEGLIIADQSPNKLAPDALRNTNVQIAHQLRDAHDRESIANALIMDEEQRDFLGKLEPGKAALFYTGLQKATFIEGVNYPKRYPQLFGENVTDVRVKAHMNSLTSQYRRIMLPFVACAFCTSQCDYRLPVIELHNKKVYDKEIQTAFRVFGAKDVDEQTQAQAFTDMVRYSSAALSEINPENFQDAGWCFFLHKWDQYVKESSDTITPEINQLFRYHLSAQQKQEKL